MLVLSSPSGAGKTSISRRLLKEDAELSMSVSVTTRPKRPGETDGVDYHFIEQARFAAMVGKHALLEHAEVFGHSYGTPREPVERKLADGGDVIFDIDWQGTQQVREKAREDLVSVFILPPSRAELERRLRERAQDPPDVVAGRMAKADAEMSHYPEYDYIIINDDFERSVALVKQILAAERLRRDRQEGLAEFVRGLQDE